MNVKTFLTIEMPLNSKGGTDETEFHVRLEDWYFGRLVADRWAHYLTKF